MKKLQKATTFRVTVEKTLYCTGTIEVAAKDWEAALRRISNKINAGKLQASTIEWGEPEYEEGSFKTTGDID